MVIFNVQIAFYIQNVFMCFINIPTTTFQKNSFITAFTKARRWSVRIHKSQTLECMYWKRCVSVLVMNVYVGAEVYLHSFFT